MRLFIPRFLIFCVMPVVAVAQGDASSTAVSELKLRDALEIAAANSPVLRARALELKAADARVDRAGLRPPLSLSGDLENFVGTGQLGGIDALETTLRLGAVVELGDRRQRRVELATTERAASAAAVERARIDVLGQVAIRFVDMAEAQELLAESAREVELANAAITAVRRRMEIGAAPRFELDKAEIALAQAQIHAEHVDHLLASTRRSLAASLGQREPAFARVAANLFTLPPTAPFPMLVQRMERNADLVALAAEERIAAARVRLAEASQRPDVAISAGLRRLEGLDDTAAVLGFSMPLGSRPRAQANIREAAALRDSNGEQQTAARLELESTLFALANELEHSRFELAAWRGPLQARATSILEQVERGFRQGRFSFPEFALAQSQLSETRRRAIEVAAQFHKLLIDIERLTGRSASIPSE
jgi:cobalt-zinc-cadmium efflux system outer membrane protein